jgi:hypothetical protein
VRHAGIIALGGFAAKARDSRHIRASLSYSKALGVVTYSKNPYWSV